ncbi:alkaline phosphatase [Flagelloscypha sp. PMI_526]|nr:alkaline phosphatase [Flagelloscypha sp. PMI_526]
MKASGFALLAAHLVAFASAQTFQRLGTCPTLGCVFPPDQTDFLPGQYFDIRLEVHAPTSGPEAYGNGTADENFSFCIQKGNGGCTDAAKFFKTNAPALEKWSFTFVFTFASSRSYSHSTMLQLDFAISGDYTAKLSYYGSRGRKAKNAIFFIGDGMTQNMITAARLIGHKSINGKYQSLMQMDTMEALGHSSTASSQMTHSIDSFITDSANSATALYSGKKSSVNALNVYADSSKDPFDDPKFETMFELFKRVRKGPVGVVSTANVQDATPAAQCAHTRDRPNRGGAEYFFASNITFNNTDWYNEFSSNGYKVAKSKTELEALGNKDKALGIFSTGVMAKWLDRNVYPDNLKTGKTSPTGDGTAATDQPGLKDITLKAIDILNERQKSKNTGFFMMSEAASIDKMMHVLDYDRALGELLELDDTIRATIAHLKKLGIEDETLIVVTADHGHGFDVFGGADTKYLAQQSNDRLKRKAVGTYANSGLSGYQVAAGSNPQNATIIYGDQGPNFPVQWNPRYAYAAGFAANPDHREGYTVNTSGPRLPATAQASNDYTTNPADQPSGFSVGGTLPPSSSQGVHSLTDVSVYANGPGAEEFRGVYNSPDIFFKFADILGLAN